MKRVAVFKGSDVCVNKLNEWLDRNPKANLVDIKPVVLEERGYVVLFAILDIPENSENSSENSSENLGAEAEGGEEGSEL